MISKEAFRLIVAAIGLSAGKTQEELAIDMGYGKNYISELLSPTGKVTDKFVKAFKSHYREYLENPKKDDDPLSRTEIADLIRTNRVQAEAILNLSIRISSDRPGPASSPAAEGRKGSAVEDLKLSGKRK